MTNPVQDAVMGHACNTTKAPGHWVLARLGKKVLRPGGMELTRRMLESLAVNERDDVVEFAPGLGATARITLRKSPRSYVAIERDERAATTVRQLLTEPRHRCILGRAEQTGLGDQCATVVYGEAMLTMQSQAAKSRIISEAARLLVPGGRYGIHEIALVPDEIDTKTTAQICSELSDAIHHSVAPLTLTGWRDTLSQHGFHVRVERTAPMHLLEPSRLLADEGFGGAMRFAWNLLRDTKSRERVMRMRGVFRKYENHLAAITLVSEKRQSVE
ncbi:MAG: class I SAM-dependent methyltransferase [Phycisphaerales bacterium]|nr:class I SAM-dependent methyltransferase [Phycisphaerales bacterium]